MPKTIPFSNVDAAWLQMEDPTNLMMISGVLLLDKPADMARLRKTLEYRLLPMNRFTMRVKKNRLPMRPPVWEQDPNFDLDAHIHHIALPTPGDTATLQETISDLMSTGLDFSKPLWQFHVIDNYGDGSVILGRIHHTIGDGTALVAVMMSLMDFVPNMKLKKPKEKAKKAGGWNPLGAILNPARAAIGMTRKVAETVLHEGMETWQNPRRALEMAETGVRGVESLSKSLLMSSDPQTLFKGKLGVKKLPAWSKTIPLKDVKKVSKVMGAKINDVLLTAMTGGLRRYLIEKGTDVTDMNFRAAVPVNLRPMERALELGNEFSLIFLSLPVGIEDPLERLFTLKKRMDAIKDSPDAMVNFGLLNVVGASPGQVADQIINMFGSKATAVMTNVPGPKMPLYIAGSKIDNMIFWVPQSGRLGLGVSIFSYAGKVTLGVVTDAGLVPDPEKIIDGFHTEFEALMDMVRQVEADEAAAVANKASLEASVAQLEVLEAKVAGMEGEVVDTLVLCAGITKSGRPCRNRAQEGRDFCHLHK